MQVRFSDNALNSAAEYIFKRNRSFSSGLESPICVRNRIIDMVRNSMNPRPKFVSSFGVMCVFTEDEPGIVDVMISVDPCIGDNTSDLDVIYDL